MARAGAINLDVKGVKETQAKLQRLRPALQRKAIRPSVQAAGTVMAKAARQSAPIGTAPAIWKNGKNKGQARKRLRKTIATRMKTYGNGSIVCVVGSRSREAPHGHLVEDGTKAHVIPGPVKLGGRVYRNLQHPGTSPRRWLRRAMQSSTGNQQTAFRAKLTEKVEQVAKTA